MDRIVCTIALAGFCVVCGIASCVTQIACGRRRQRQSDDDARSNMQAQLERRNMIKRKLAVYDWVHGNATVGAVGTTDSLGNGEKPEVEGKIGDVLNKMERLRKMSTIRGTDEIALASSYSFNDEADCCVICLANFENGQRVCESSNIKCKHTFHEGCMINWLMKNSNCPICRAPYLEETI